MPIRGKGSLSDPSISNITMPRRSCWVVLDESRSLQIIGPFFRHALFSVWFLSFCSSRTKPEIHIFVSTCLHFCRKKQSNKNHKFVRICTYYDGTAFLGCFWRLSLLLVCFCLFAIQKKTVFFRLLVVQPPNKQIKKRKKTIFSYCEKTKTHRQQSKSSKSNQRTTWHYHRNECRFLQIWVFLWDCFFRQMWLSLRQSGYL